MNMGNYTYRYNPISDTFDIVQDITLIHMKDAVDTYNDLPITGNSENDARFVKDTDILYVWSIPSTSGDISNWKETAKMAIPDLDALDDGSIYGRVKNTELESGQVKRLDDGINEVSAGDAKDAVDKKHTQGTDTTLGAQAEDLDMNNYSIVNLKDDSIQFQGGDALRRNEYLDTRDKRHTQDTDTILKTVISEASIGYTTLDWDDGNPFSSTNDVFGQSFKSIRTEIKEVKFYFTKEGSPTGNLIVEIQGDNGSNEPDGNILGSKTLLGGSIVDGDWNTWTFDTPITVLVDTQYFIVIKVSGGVDGGNRYLCHTKYGNPYINGSFVWSMNGGSSWIQESDGDLLFEVVFGGIVDLINNGELKNDLSVTAGKKIGTKTIEEITDSVDKKHIQNTDNALAPQSENLNMNTHRISNLADPIEDQDGATKKFVVDAVGVENLFDYVSPDTIVPHVANRSIDIGSGDFITTGKISDGINEIEVSRIEGKATETSIYYVNCDTGDDGNPGTEGEPFATIQHAIDISPKLLGKWGLVIGVQSSQNYTESLDISGFYGGYIRILGMTGNADDVVFRFTETDSIYAQNCTSIVRLEAMTFIINKDNARPLRFGQAISGQVKDCNFGTEGYTNTKGIYTDKSCHISIRGCGNSTLSGIDNVAIGVNPNEGSVVGHDGNLFGDNPFTPTKGAIVSDAIVLSASAYDDAISKKHEHSNKSILDNITEAFTSALKSTYDAIVSAFNAHKDDADGVHGIPSGDSIAGISDIGIDENLSAEAQDAISKKHIQNTDIALRTDKLTIDATGNTTVVGELKIKVFAQASEPTLNADEYMAIWKDTDDLNRVYLLFRRGVGDQVAVELA